MLSPVPIIVVDADQVEDPLDAVLRPLPLLPADTSSSPIVILAGSETGLTRGVVSWFAGHGDRAELLPPPPRGMLAGLRSAWSRVPVANEDARYAEVALARAAAAPRRAALVADLGAGDATPVDLLLRYVHPRVAAAIRFSPADLGAAADVSLGFNVSVALLSSAINGRRIVAATPDLVAGQLLALAFHILAHPDDEDRIGPWENPVVQRATELGLGLIHPGQLDLTCRPASAEYMEMLCREVSLLLGIT